MCGIAGIHIFNPDNAPKWSKFETAVDDLFTAIDHRGGDATGFVAVSPGETTWQKASCGAFDFFKDRRMLPFGFRSVILHTRMATQGNAAFPENNHPVKRGKVYIVHNGHIWNDYNVFRDKKIDRYGQVDSEAIAALISKYGIMRTHEAMEELSGAAAIGVVDESKPGLMVLARGSSSPLMFYRNEDIAIFGSTKEAVKKAWKGLYGTAPKDKKIEDVDEGVAIYLDNDKEERMTFRPDDYYYTRSQYVPSKVISTVSKESWSNGHYSYNDPGLTIVSPYGGREISSRNLDYLEKGLCKHFIDYLDCEICNPDDEEGSYLTTGSKQAWINAQQCDLCDAWFGEDELVRVQDWEDKWIFCDKCMDEMSDVIAESDISRPVRIYNLSDEEIAAL